MLKRTMRTFFFSILFSLFGFSSNVFTDECKGYHAPQTDVIAVNAKSDFKANMIYVDLKRPKCVKYNWLGKWVLKVEGDIAFKGYGKTINEVKPQVVVKPDQDPKKMKLDRIKLFNEKMGRFEIPIEGKLSKHKGKKLKINIRYFYCDQNDGWCKPGRWPGRKSKEKEFTI